MIASAFQFQSTWRRRWIALVMALGLVLPSLLCLCGSAARAEIPTTQTQAAAASEHACCHKAADAGAEAKRSDSRPKSETRCPHCSATGDLHTGAARDAKGDELKPARADGVAGGSEALLTPLLLAAESQCLEEAREHERVGSLIESHLPSTPDVLALRCTLQL